MLGLDDAGYGPASCYILPTQTLNSVARTRGLSVSSTGPMGYYDTSQVCLNGHVVTDTLSRSPELGQKFCRDCGQPTIQ